MRRASILLILLIALLSASCSTTGGSDEDSNRRIAITLPENESTGYSWIWGQMGAGHIEMVGENFIPATGEGEAGEHVFIFEGTKPGHVTLTFSARNDDNGGATGDTEAFSVTVYDDMTISYL